ncbi:hypothetical protein SAY87_032138 [Trapa incisa]|uniref:Uncharacterized protein n=1 Tax=Trapa incisa TaxID=236973 RepID=A0AAN7KYH9_9MYRT|nr:hypothetical protein SAY87_032138 [Trapa incisa]
MANPSGGNKFVSVNLNKSYGQQQHHHSTSYSSRTARAPNSYHHGGGGMVVLSRPRSSQKNGPKLSIPPPMNLPSLKKEHEKFDSLGTGGGPIGGGIAGSGLRPSSSGMGWTKPVMQEKEDLASAPKGALDHDIHIGGVDGLSNKGMRALMHYNLSVSPSVTVERSPVLRGEDFPSLVATLPVAQAPPHKLKDRSAHKPKQVESDVGIAADGLREGPNVSSHVDLHPQQMSSRRHFSNGLRENESENTSLGISQMREHSRMEDDYFAGPLPLVRLNPRSDWADDERDIGHGLLDRGKDHGFLKSDAYWEGDIDVLKTSYLPTKSGNSYFDQWTLHDSETENFSPSQVPKAGLHGRDARTPSREGREGNSWRASSPLSKDNVSLPETGIDRSRFSGRASSIGTEMKKDNKYVPSLSRDGLQNEANSQGVKLPWNNTRGRYGNDSILHHSIASKSSVGSRGSPFNDIGHRFTKDKRLMTKNEKPYSEEPILKDFGDGWDHLQGNILGVVKRRKDVPKDTDFHDPVRESFEAELDRVQKMQEQERQRIIEEQERSLELTRREEEERARLAREQEEMQRKLEEEAREAAWKAEQERLEALHRAEEQRLAREEEKRKILMEEERRKQAAKQKLLELEEKIAKRQADAVNDCNKSSLADGKVAELVKDSSRLRETENSMSDGGDWEDSERMPERTMTSASSDSSLSKPFEVKSRSNISKGSSSVFIERGKSTSTSRRDTFENGNSTTFPMKEPEGGVYGPKLEPSFGGKSFSRNEIYGGAGFGTSRNYSKGRESDFQMDGYSQSRGQRWNLANGDTFSRNTDVDTEFPEDLADKFGDVWGQGRPHNNLYPLHPDQYYHHEVDSPYSSGRSRHSMRQPRVPPPLSLASTHNRRGDNERPGPSSLLDGIPCDSTGRGESNAQMDYDSSRQENAEMVSINTVVEQKPDQGEALRCDSQSSLSVSSPPDSPVHISHDDLDEFNDYPLKSAAEEDDDFLMNGETGQVNIMTIPSSASSGVDDREWTLDNNSGLQEQEEYDEDELGYREDDVREGEDEHIHLSQEFEDMHLEDKTSAIMMDSSVLCIRNDARVQLTNDELEVSSRKDVGAFPSQMVSAEGMESLKRDDLTHLHGEASPQVTIKSQENETFMPAAVTKTSDNLDDNSRSHALSSYQAAPSGSTSTVLQSAGHTIMPSAPSFPTQAEIPVKLQFGLFSGPSLIPTPVPAIQIGSIQMPLHLHPHPLGQPVHPSQSPIFQFGQLRYTSPVSHGAVSLTPQSMSFLHPSIPANFPFNKNPDGPMSTQTGEDDSAQNLENMKNAPSSMSIRQGLVSRPSDLSEGNVPVEVNPLPARERRDHFVVSHSGREEQVDEKEVAKKNRPLSKSKEWEDQAKIGAAPVQLGKQDRDFAGSKFHGSVSSNRGKHYIFKVKNDASKTSFLYSEASQSDGSGYQRRPRHLAKRAEFRVRDNSEKRQAINFGSADQLGLEDRSNMNGKNVIVHARSGTRKATNNRVTKYSLDSEGKASGSTNIQELPCGNEVDGTRRESSIKGQVIQHSHSIEGSNKRDTREEDVDTSLQSGVVRVFEQPGIEAPSDEDDFIEVRSKRQMLNDKREQREKEIKAKSRISKAPRRSRSFLKHTASPSLKTTVISGEGAGSSIHTDFAATEARKLADFEVSSGFNPNLSSQRLAPISMPPAKDDISADLRDQNCMTCPDVAFKDNNVDDVQTSLDSWVEHPGINQPVMALTQSQLDEAMKPANFDSRISVCDHTTAVSEHIIPSSSILVKDSQFSSAAASISSLLDGEKIQFGAVTTPTVLLPSAHLGSHGIGSPGSCQLDIQMPNTIIPAKSNCSIFLKEKSDESCAHFEDCEAEAEAAASAVAVAAISNDEIIGKGLGTCSLSVSDTKSYGTANEGGIAAGVSGDQQSENQSRAEETLSVSLPADLSVETPPMSLWPPLTPSQTTSTQMLSHFPSAPPPHLSFYDMNVNTMMGSPIFAFGPNEDTSSAPQSHAQKNSTPSSGTHATWHHSGMESFYGSPAGFTGPFIGPGGIAGVQAPPHMVVYNHFAPVGQFGQVGLSFMGTTLIQSGKQPDWKHNPSRPCTTSVGEGDVNDINVLSTQRNAIGMPSPVQHLAPGSPMLPVASPLPMFDVAPFQSSTEVPIHARWSHLPSSTFHSIPMSMPMQQQTEGLLPLLPQYPNKANNVPPPVEQSEATNKPGEGNQDYRLGAATGPTATQLPDELGLVEESSGSSFPGTSKHVHVAANSASDSGHISTLHGNKNQSGSSASIPFITRSRNSQHYGAPSSSSSGYSNNSHRRAAGYHGGRNHSFGSEKGLSSSTGRVKQIYVAKQRNQPAMS